MDHLAELENTSIYIIREAYSRFKRIGLLWSMGKDSTAMLWMCRKAFFGEIPFPIIHIDTGYKFAEMYAFRDRLAREWRLDLRIARNTTAIEAGMSPTTGSKLDCCHQLKTQALKDYLAEMQLTAILLAIRRDEHGIRAKERYFSPRDEQFTWNYHDQPPELWDQFKSSSEGADHVRVHPMLHMTEVDIWRYIQREGIPVNGLYFARRGKRYRSLGCECCCAPGESNAATVEEIIAELETTTVSERSFRAQDKEDTYTMQKLRSLGYM
ncbi:MAG: Sulfate adenylyltransferase subunit 2 [bacterium ADurb.Bin429]|nr:MAG: Sulfate adenylyltransferase subunit 2 [bacterium ADurb.Bin429]